MSTTILLGFGACLVLLAAGGAWRSAGVSPAVWGVVAWFTLIASRPVSAWLDMGSAQGSMEAYDEGNPLDRLVFFALMLQALFVLVRRGVRWREVIAANAWVAVFFLYCWLSIFWADSPLVAAKRWSKDFGNLLMVLVVLTDPRPREAIRAVAARSACLLLPMSILFIRFVPELGRTYHVWSGEMMYTGVATHKNSLGALALVSLLFLVDDFFASRDSDQPPRALVPRLAVLALIAMAAWLLAKAASATASGCAVFGVTLLAALGWKPLQRRVRTIEVAVTTIALALWATDAAQGVMNFVVVDLLGRDLTLTSRTDVWPILLSKADNVWVGSGFNSFWTGDRLALLYSQFGIIQAHNGYLEAYLNGGLAGIALLGVVLLSALWRAGRRVEAGAPGAALAFAIVCIAVTYNFTEASFGKMSPLWFVFLLVVIEHKHERPAERALLHAPAGEAGQRSGASGEMKPLPIRVPW